MVIWVRKSIIMDLRVVMRRETGSFITVSVNFHLFYKVNSAGIYGYQSKEYLCWVVLWHRKVFGDGHRSHIT